MAPEARLEHAIAGRIRLRVPAKRGDAHYFSRVREALIGLPGTGVVTVAPRTGGVLLEDTTLAPDALEALGLERGLFRLTLRPAATTAAAPLEVADWLEDWVTGSPRAKLVLASGLVGLALMQVARGQVLGPAVNLLWSAYELSRHSLSISGRTAGQARVASRAIH